MRLPFGFEITKNKAKSINIGTVLGSNNFLGLSNEAITPTDFRAQVNAYRSWVYICVRLNSEGVAKQKLKLYVAKTNNKKIIGETRPISKQKKEYLYQHSSVANLPCVCKSIDIEEVIEHPFLELMKNVNNWENRFDLWEKTEMFLELTGNSYWYILNNNLGTPVELWILPSHRMSIVPDKDKFINGYIYTKDWNEKIPFDNNEIIHYKFASPHNPFYGMGIIAGIESAYNLNENMNIYGQATFRNMGRLDGGFITTELLNEIEFKRLQQQIKDKTSGVKNQGKTLLLPKGLDYKQFALSPRELDFLMGKKITREEIAGAFGVPLSKLTTESVNKANAEAGERQWARDTILPRLIRIEEKINEKLMPRYDDDIFVVFDSPIPEDKVYALKERIGHVKEGITTRNEERQKLGLDPKDGLDDIYMPFNLAPVGSSRPSPEQEVIEETMATRISEKVLKNLKQYYNDTNT